MSEPAIIAFEPCWLCGHHFSFNVARVPSYDPSFDDSSQPAGRRPICEDCITMANERRRKMGLREWEVFPDSYGPGSPADLEE
jgi:hypothetical protein